MRRPTVLPAALLMAAIWLLQVPSHPVHAQTAATDLDQLMARVLARRDENWKKMRQYVLDERERLSVTGPDRARVFGFAREYTWFIRDGFFIRSPISADGVKVGEDERLRYEARWLTREKGREERRLKRERDKGTANDAADPADPPPSASPGDSKVEDVLKATFEPRFVSAAYFLEFKFDPGHYALAGREQLDGRSVLRIEYYPSLLFREGRTRPNRRARERDAEVGDKMNKVSLVTLWIDPAEHQILKYTFENMDMDFLPARSIVRVDEMKASMRMTQPFPDVWLPAGIDMEFAMTLAIGTFGARYDIEYRDYRLAEVTMRIKP